MSGTKDYEEISFGGKVWCLAIIQALGPIEWDEWIEKYNAICRLVSQDHPDLRAFQDLAQELQDRGFVKLNVTAQGHKMLTEVEEAFGPRTKRTKRHAH